MKKKILVLVLMFYVMIALSACVSSITQKEYNEVVKERDELQDKYDELQDAYDDLSNENAELQEQQDLEVNLKECETKLNEYIAIINREYEFACITLKIIETVYPATNTEATQSQLDEIYETVSNNLNALNEAIQKLSDELTLDDINSVILSVDESYEIWEDTVDTLISVYDGIF